MQFIVVPGGEASGVGTVFITSAVGIEDVWEDDSTRADSYGGRDEYGPYTACFLQKLKPPKKAPR